MADAGKVWPPAPPMPALPLLRALPALPVGAVFAFAGDAARLTHSLARQGFLVCDGQRVPVSEFHELYRVIGDIYTPQPDGRTFSVPDLRGYFLRGVDPDGRVDPDGSGRVRPSGATGPLVGSIQACAFQVHEHDYLPAAQAVAAAGEAAGAISATATSTTAVVQGQGPTAPLTSDRETRPVNVYVFYLIKYTTKLIESPPVVVPPVDLGGPF